MNSSTATHTLPKTPKEKKVSKTLPKIWEILTKEHGIWYGVYDVPIGVQDWVIFVRGLYAVAIIFLLVTLMVDNPDKIDIDNSIYKDGIVCNKHNFAVQFDHQICVFTGLGNGYGWRP